MSTPPNMVGNDTDCLYKIYENTAINIGYDISTRPASVGFLAATDRAINTSPSSDTDIAATRYIATSFEVKIVFKSFLNLPSAIEAIRAAIKIKREVRDIEVKTEIFL